MTMIKVSALPWAWQAPPVRLVLQSSRPPGPRAPAGSSGICVQTAPRSSSASSSRPGQSLHLRR